MTINFQKNKDGLVPVIVQDHLTGKVLMLGYMNEQAYQETVKKNKVVFYSRSKQRLWMKGEKSGNFMEVKEMRADCDRDTILIKALPAGPVCHTGADTCFTEKNVADSFLPELERIIQSRKRTPLPSSYTSSLFQKGINKIAQKVGEEAIEVIIEAKDNNDELFLNESADLLYHFMVLLQAKNKTMEDVMAVLKKRYKK